MVKQSAGILPFRFNANNSLAFFLVHPGGPFWKNKDIGVWSVAKGEFGDDEEPLAAAQREFQEETGKTISGNFIALPSIKYKNGKIVHAWAIEADLDHTAIKSNYFEMEWPPRSGKKASFEEVDKAGWFTIEVARDKIIPAQAPFLESVAKLPLHR